MTGIAKEKGSKMEWLIPFGMVLLLFVNVLFNVLEIPSFFRFWDEIVSILIIAVGLFIIPKDELSKIKVPLLLLFLVTVIGLCGNIFFDYSVPITYVFRDVIVFLKFPLVFLVSFLLFERLQISERIKKICLFIIEAIVGLIALFGIISLSKNIGMSQDEIRFGIKSYKFLFPHPSNLVLTMVMSLCLIDSLDVRGKRKTLFELLCLIIIMMTMRTKGFVFVGAFIAIKFVYRYFYKYRKFLFVILPVLAIILSFYKIMEYTTYDTTPRGSLYQGAVQISNENFPLGSGFASFGSDLSVRAESRVYDNIDISFYYHNGVLVKDIYDDAGLAFYLGEFGYIGFLIFALLLATIFRYALFGVGAVNEKGIKNRSSVLALIVYVIVALPAEAVFTNNGLEIAIMLSFLACLCRERRGRIA